MKLYHLSPNKIFLLSSATLMLMIFLADRSYGSDLTVQGNLFVGDTVTPGGVTIAGSTGSAAAPGLQVNGDGGVVFKGGIGVGTIPATGAGARMMWYPKKVAFRAGNAAGDYWNDENIGSYSVAFGSISKASGMWSFAHGINSVASSSAAVALGMDSTASGSAAFSMGMFTTASAQGAVAMGTNSRASSEGAVAFGNGNASGLFSTALGYRGIASGNYSLSAGNSTTAVAFSSFVIGRNNKIEGNATSWIQDDPLFVIGNGTGIASDPVDVKNRNAFTVYKSGDVLVSGHMKIMKRHGDIAMGEFGTAGSGD